MKKILPLLFITLFIGRGEDIGEQLYNKYGCYGCHGSNAEGIGDFPKLAGKPEMFLQKRLLGYKQGTIRSNRANMMAPFAKKLSTEDIEAIAHYLSTLHTNKTTQERYYEEFVVGDSSGS